ncbi:effector-associated constant component EACC1 [Streptomyces sp. NPDC003635]
MQVKLRLIDETGAGATGAELVALRKQLTARPELRGHVEVVPAEAEEGEMGGGLELLLIGLGSGGAVTALITTLPALLSARRSPTSVEITLADGRSAKVTADSVEDARTLLEEAFRDHLNPPRP